MVEGIRRAFPSPDLPVLFSGATCNFLSVHAEIQCEFGLGAFHIILRAQHRWSVVLNLGLLCVMAACVLFSQNVTSLRAVCADRDSHVDACNFV